MAVVVDGLCITIILLFVKRGGRERERTKPVHHTFPEVSGGGGEAKLKLA